MIVIRTLAGRAQGVAHHVDRLNNPDILGTVGGDDTVLIIAREGFSKHDVIRALKNKFPVLKTIIR